MDNTAGLVAVEHHEPGIAVVSINRPEALNALNKRVLTELKAALEVISSDPKVRVVVLRGAGEKAFIAGADIREMQNMNRSEAADLSRLGHSVCLMLEQMPKVTIAAVHGFALGGGTEITLACDFILASEKALFGLPEVSLGVIPGFGGTIRLARAVVIACAKQLIFTGARINATEAKDLGLIHHIYPQVSFFDDVLAYSKKIAVHSLDAIVVAKKLLNEFEENIGTYFKIDALLKYWLGAFSCGRPVCLL